MIMTDEEIMNHVYEITEDFDVSNNWIMLSSFAEDYPKDNRMINIDNMLDDEYIADDDSHPLLVDATGKEATNDDLVNTCQRALKISKLQKQPKSKQVKKEIVSLMH